MVLNIGIEFIFELFFAGLVIGGIPFVMYLIVYVMIRILMRNFSETLQKIEGYTESSTCSEWDIEDELLYCRPFTPSPVSTVKTQFEAFEKGLMSRIGKRRGTKKTLQMTDSPKPLYALVKEETAGVTEKFLPPEMQKVESEKGVLPSERSLYTPSIADFGHLGGVMFTVTDGGELLQDTIPIQSNNLPTRISPLIRLSPIKKIRHKASSPTKKIFKKKKRRNKVSQQLVTSEENVIPTEDEESPVEIRTLEDENTLEGEDGDIWDDKENSIQELHSQQDGILSERVEDSSSDMLNLFSKDAAAFKNPGDSSRSSSYTNNSSEQIIMKLTTV